MIGLGLSAADLATYKAALKQSHTIGCRATLLDQNERVVQTLAGPGPASALGFIGGQVDVDDSQAIARQATVTLTDPGRHIQVVKNGAGDYQIWADSFLHLEYGVYVAALSRWVFCPVFTGPVTGFERSWPEVTFTCQGKEYLAQDPYLLLTSRTYHRGEPIVNVIKDLMGQVGEWNFGMAGITQTLSHKLVVPRLADPWAHCKKLADTTNRHLWYDGRGQLRLDQKPKHEVYAFTLGANGNMLSIPDFTADFTTFHNYVDVVGGTPKKAKVKIHAAESAGGNNPLSSIALARRGTPRRAVDAINDSQILRKTTAQTRAKNQLSGDIEIGTDTEFDCLPVPFLEEHDWVTVETDTGGHTLTKLTKWSLPLSDDSMTVGNTRQMRYVKHLRPARAGRHKKRRH